MEFITDFYSSFTVMIVSDIDYQLDDIVYKDEYDWKIEDDDSLVLTPNSVSRGLPVQWIDSLLHIMKHIYARDPNYMYIHCDDQITYSLCGSTMSSGILRLITDKEVSVVNIIVDDNGCVTKEVHTASGMTSDVLFDPTK